MDETASNKEDYSVKQYIKEELTRYHFYEKRIRELQKDIQNFKVKYRDIINDPPIGGSIIKMPDGTPNNQNIVMRLESRLNDMESDLKHYRDRIAIMDNWLGVLTEDQNRVARVYIMRYKCKDVDHAALELEYSRDTVKKYPSKICDRILKKVTKIY